MTVSETLRLDIEEYVTTFRSSNQLLIRARSGDLKPEVVVRYIDGLRYLLRHTDVNMKLARLRSEELGRRRLADYFEHKAKEEAGHDLWADKDLATLSAMFGVASPAAPARSIAALVEYLRSMIAEEPVQYLAYILFVEYVTVLLGPEWLQALDEHCGIPVSAMSVVGKHVELDRDHAAEGLREIDLLVPDDENVDLLRGALRRSMEYFDVFCSEISGTLH
jgi:pyrroloquinoline quinone (PQQ) biosynthesis protein C